MKKIRKATLKDIQKIAGLLHEYDLYENRLDKKHRIDPMKEIIETYTKIMKSPQSVFLILEIDGNLEGIVSGEDRQTAMEKNAIIHQIFISEKFRNKGYGKKLLKEIENYFKKRGCDSISSFVFKNNKNSLRLYKRIGYKTSEGTQIKKKLK